jgi:outer membrane protein insertion porin family
MVRPRRAAKGGWLLSRNRLVLIATTAMLPILAAGAAEAQQPARSPRPANARLPVPATTPRTIPAGNIQTIRVEGNQRIETGTVLSYMSVGVGDPFDPDRIDRSLKTLYATGLFQDVKLTRDGNSLVVRVVENPIIDKVTFEGNRLITDDAARALITERPRSVYTPEIAQADRQKILDAYAKRARFAATVEPKIIRLPQNRVDVVFEINDGASTLISRIAFVGNHAFGESRLREVINSREEAFWRLLGNSDSFDPARVDFDKELLRHFYMKNGYADFKVTDATAELSADRKSFFLTFVLDEGARYRIGKVDLESKINGVPPAQLKPLLEIDPGDWYDGDAVDRAVTTITQAVQARGYAFVEVNPLLKRDTAKHVVDLNFSVVEGPRVYVERIDITGNTRTKDKVIRREFQVAEGDAFNADAVRRTRQRLQDLGYFNNVTITSNPGSAPDRALLNTNVDEKATGELTLGGGYSTDIGALANVGLHERNLIGTGIDASINGVIAQRETNVTLSATDPYFLDRNLTAGFDLFDINDNNQVISQYNESRVGGDLRLGYNYNDHLSQAYNYTLVQRNVYDIASSAGIYVQNEAGRSLLSQLGTIIALDYRDSRLQPHSGFLIRIGEDFAGAGGDVHYIRSKIDGSYYFPLDAYTGSSDWFVSVSAGAGYLSYLGGQQRIIDNFFLGGDNLRGFYSGGVGPRDAQDDSLGGRFIWTQSTELHYPLPISPDLGLSGRAFVDIGQLSQTVQLAGQTVYNSTRPRMGAGIGFSWNTPFGLINIDLATPILRQSYQVPGGGKVSDKSQFFRFGFGTRF